MAIPHRSHLPRPNPPVQGLSPDVGHDFGWLRLGRETGCGVYRACEEGEESRTRTGTESEIG